MFAPFFSLVLSQFNSPSQLIFGLMKFCKFSPIKCDLDKCDKRTAHYRTSRLFNVKFGIIPGSGGVVTTLINKVTELDHLLTSPIVLLELM